MRKRNIFLSYRRHDTPGYVRILEEELEKEFGDNRVFRDTSDIPGGVNWRQTIEDNIKSSAVLLLIIGKHWERLWVEQDPDDENYVAYELELAERYDVKVITVTVEGVEISKNCDLGEISWIRDEQHVDLSDRQRRWRSDFAELVSILEKIDGIGPSRSTLGRGDQRPAPRSPSRLRWLGAGAALALVLVGFAAYDYFQVDPVPFVDNGLPFGADLATASPDTDVVPDEDYHAPAAAARAPAAATNAAPAADPVALTGTWQGLDGTLYYLQQYPDGTFEVQSPGYTYGYGMPLQGVPRAYEVELAGVGYGQFAVSGDGRTIDGWMDIGGERVNDRLVRIQ